MNFFPEISAYWRKDKLLKIVLYLNFYESEIKDGLNIFQSTQPTNLEWPFRCWLICVFLCYSFAFCIFCVNKVFYIKFSSDGIYICFTSFNTCIDFCYAIIKIFIQCIFNYIFYFTMTILTFF